MANYFSQKARELCGEQLGSTVEFDYVFEYGAKATIRGELSRLAAWPEYVLVVLGRANGDSFKLEPDAVVLIFHEGCEP